MLTIYEIVDGKLIEHTFSAKTEFYLESISHLIVYPISDNFLCITNSFRNRSFLVSKDDWRGVGNYPSGLLEYISYPIEPLKTIDMPQKDIDIMHSSISFSIVMSYECNLRCKYCYQQCNPDLNKEKITSENLSVILNTISQYHLKHPDKTINIELFGGEPLLVENHDDIIKIFDFCVENRFSVCITTNGVNLPYYLKDLVIYSGLNITIGTTIDSIYSNESTRYSFLDGNGSRSGRILKSVKTLINNDITVVVETNVDQHNIDQLGEMIHFYQVNGFLDNPNFYLGIARVDDRRFETGYDKMVSDSKLISRLLDLNITEPNIYFAFVKSSLALCRKLDPAFRQMEKKYISNYCWASAPLDMVFYIDPDLDVFRCTFTVGRKEYSQFKLSLEALEDYKMPDRTYLDYTKCQRCVIGGYCSGGCALSAGVDFDRMCSLEMLDFNSFLTDIFYPRVRALMCSLPALEN